MKPKRIERLSRNSQIRQFDFVVQKRVFQEWEAFFVPKIYGDVKISVLYLNRIILHRGTLVCFIKVLKCIFTKKSNKQESRKLQIRVGK